MESKGPRVYFVAQVGEVLIRYLPGLEPQGLWQDQWWSSTTQVWTFGEWGDGDGWRHWPSEIPQKRTESSHTHKCPGQAVLLEDYSSSKLTCLAGKSPFFDSRYIFNWLFFPLSCQCYSFSGGVRIYSRQVSFFGGSRIRCFFKSGHPNLRSKEVPIIG